MIKIINLLIITILLSIIVSDIYAGNLPPPLASFNIDETPDNFIVHIEEETFDSEYDCREAIPRNDTTMCCTVVPDTTLYVHRLHTIIGTCPYY